MNFLAHFNKALEFEDYVKLLGENLSLHKLHYNNFDLQNEDAQSLKDLPSVNILVITEPWCGDSFALLPVVKKISEANSTWKLKIILRDKNPDLIDRFLTKGGRAIPIFLFLDNDYKHLFKWGPRPLAAQNIFEQFRTQINNGEIERSKVILKIRQFYSRNKGKAASQELFNLIYSNLK
jgi:thiol-disulfide isomerase/thioredoxin